MTERRDAAPGNLVLVIEDDADLRDSLVDVLRDGGWQTATARDGEAALTLLRGGLAPGVIVLDLMMPGMNGYTFRETQLDDALLRDIPVLIFTADRMVGARERELRADAYLPKPGDVDRLLAELRRIAR